MVYAEEMLTIFQRRMESRGTMPINQFAVPYNSTRESVNIIHGDSDYSPWPWIIFTVELMNPQFCRIWGASRSNTVAFGSCQNARGRSWSSRTHHVVTCKLLQQQGHSYVGMMASWCRSIQRDRRADRQFWVELCHVATPTNLIKNNVFNIYSASAPLYPKSMTVGDSHLNQ